MPRVKALALRPAVAPSPSPSEDTLPQLCTAVMRAVRGGEARLELGGRETRAAIDETVHPAVLEGAAARGERVLVERRASGLVVVGALRTQPTPGVDRADSYRIEADDIRIEAGRELSLGARTAGVVLRAAGEVETWAERIVSRASGVHKIIGSILRLN
jgi:hypothetical protein